MTTSWSIPTSPPDGPQVHSCGPFALSRPCLCGDSVACVDNLLLLWRPPPPAVSAERSSTASSLNPLLASIPHTLKAHPPKQLANPACSQYAFQVSHRDESYLEAQRESRRLAANYAGMADGELLRLARHAESLTDLAWDALEDELDRRHLELPDDSPDPAPRPQLEIRELVTIRQFRDLPEALLAKGSLESAGIECFLADENLVRLDWFISNFIGGIKLNVHPTDEQIARQLLDEPILEGLYVQGIGLYEQPRCPKCQSLDVNFQELDRPIAFMSAFLRVPIPMQRPAWRCHSCNIEWEDDGSESGTDDR